MSIQLIYFPGGASVTVKCILMLDAVPSRVKFAVSQSE